jgi:macrodomain Ter protein organizer (MatP/YcbG family)
MPKPGYRSITIRETAYNMLCEIAERLGMSLPEAVAYIAENAEIKKPSVKVKQNATKN